MFEKLFDLHGEELKTEIGKLEQVAKSKNFNLVVKQEGDSVSCIELHRADGNNKQTWYRLRTFDYWRFIGALNGKFFGSVICDPRYPSGDGNVIFTGKTFDGRQVTGKTMSAYDARRLIHGPNYEEPESIFPWWMFGTCVG